MNLRWTNCRRTAPEGRFFEQWVPPMLFVVLGSATTLCGVILGVTLTFDPDAALSVRPDLRWAVVTMVGCCVVMGWCWLYRPCSTRATSAAFVVCADLLVPAFALSVTPSFAALPVLTVFATIGLYVATFHQRRMFIVHQSWVVAAVIAITARASLDAVDAAGVLVYAALVAVVLFTAPLVAWLVLDRLRSDAEAAVYDPLTGVHNHRGGVRAAPLLFRHARILRATVTAAVIDIDAFKSINDTYGHHVGDFTLEMVAQSLRRHFPSPDVVIRTGGEEFAVLAVGVADDLTSRLRAFTHDPALRLPDDTDRWVTYSIGTAELPAGHSHTNPAAVVTSLMQRADAAMYISKRAGGNRITTCSSNGCDIATAP